ncbi:MAG: MoxR family ATPase, partial [Planctomycetes bacterium]|nr:MoxR family ATPase [Planctomycetota bacterium]
PGTAKTLLVRSFAASLDLDFRRIQFTPDLMPGDVIGTNLFNFATSEFRLSKGPVFTQLLLADEINRTPPKTQSALLQAMQEKEVTIDGETHSLGACFNVVATRNPIEQEGTYPLPEAQLDRFLFELRVTYPDRDTERELVRRHGHGAGRTDLAEHGLIPVAGVEQILQLRRQVTEVTMTEELVDYVVDLIRETRDDPSLVCGASPRAAAMLAGASRAWALLSGRDYVIPDDIKQLAEPVLAHRVVLSPGAEIEGLSATRVIERIVEKVAAPR